jgi:hypothetical protein
VYSGKESLKRILSPELSNETIPAAVGEQVVQCKLDALGLSGADSDRRDRLLIGNFRSFMHIITGCFGSKADPPCSITLRSNAAEAHPRKILPRVSAFAARCAGVLTLLALPRPTILSVVRCQLSDRVWRPGYTCSTPHRGADNLSCLAAALWRLCGGGLWACRV